MNVLKIVYNKVQTKIYENPKVIDIILMNIKMFYILMKLPNENKLQKTLGKRIDNIYMYINDKINGIFN